MAFEEWPDEICSLGPSLKNASQFTWTKDMEVLVGVAFLTQILRVLGHCHSCFTVLPTVLAFLQHDGCGVRNVACAA